MLFIVKLQMDRPMADRRGQDRPRSDFRPGNGAEPSETVGGGYDMRERPLFEQLWNGSAQMEEWTAAVSQGAVTAVADNTITVYRPRGLADE
jgi:hypothetical protein